MFFEFGVQHVICVRTGDDYNNKAAQTFTKLFYKNIFRGVQICRAFDVAKNEVEQSFGK